MAKSKFQNSEVQEEPGKKVKTPYHLARRERRREIKNLSRTVYNNNRTPKGTGFLNMGLAWDGRAIFRPRRKKLKGYQKNK